ncbi:MAG TPA: hypothetical protein VGF67_24525 [Ktedonobacteraceae bacterium]|jgi:hypothetical protein
MSINAHIPETEEERYSNSTFWEALYGSLRALVHHWVRSAPLALWRGQEEEIAADIVQEAISDTFRYARDYVCRTREKGIIFWQPLRRVSAVLAYKQYERQRRRDSSFVSVRVHQLAAQGYTTFDWRDDPLEPALQERYCEYLAEAILTISSRARTAFLVYLANRTRLQAQPSFLCSALQKRGIHLPNYRVSWPRHPQKQQEYQALLQDACRQLIQEHTNGSQLPPVEIWGPALLAELEPESAEQNLEFLILMACLEMTPPFPYPDLAFRESLRHTLRERFLHIQLERQREEEHELAFLGARLEETAPPVWMEPVNREMLLQALREKLKNIKATLAPAPEAEDVIRETEERLRTEQLPSFVNGD